MGVGSILLLTPRGPMRYNRGMKKTLSALFLAIALCMAQTASAQITLPSGASGHYDATLTFFQMENSDVDALLPPELERAAKSIPGSSHKHPVAILDQTYLDVLQPGAPAPSPGWHERTLYVLDLQLKAGNACIAHFGKQGPFAYLPIMHVDSASAKFVGNNFFGLNQHLATFDVLGGDHYNVTGTEPAFPLTQTATFSSEAPLSPAGAADLAKFLAALQGQATIGKTAVGNPFLPAGKLIQHQVDWKFSDPSTVITSISAAVVTDSPQLPSFHKEFDGINTDDRGAFRVIAPFDSSIGDVCF
jgi:hypothetical protein